MAEYKVLNLELLEEFERGFENALGQFQGEKVLRFEEFINTSGEGLELSRNLFNTIKPSKWNDEAAIELLKTVSSTKETWDALPVARKGAYILAFRVAFANGTAPTWDELMVRAKSYFDANNGIDPMTMYPFGGYDAMGLLKVGIHLIQWAIVLIKSAGAAEFCFDFTDRIKGWSIKENYPHGVEGVAVDMAMTWLAEIYRNLESL